MYGTSESNPLLGSGQGSRVRRNRPSTQNQKRPVLHTIVSKRRMRVSTVDRDVSSFQKANKKSFFYSMLNPRSTEWQAITYKWFICIVIVLDLVAFVMSTDPDLDENHEKLYKSWEAVDSWIFLTEYVLRLMVVTESAKYGSMGPIKGRIKYMTTVPALIDLAATVPYFLEQFSGYDLPTLTYLRSFRLLRILKTQGFSEAIRSVTRVFRYNSEIIFVGLWIGAS